MNTKIRSVLWLGLLIACLLSGSSLEVMAQNAPVTTIGTVINAVSNEQIVVPITVTGFTNIAAGTLTIEYDYTKIQFINTPASVINPALAGFAAIGDNDLVVPDGIHHRLVIAWGSDPVVTMPAGSYIVQLAFKYISGSTSLQFIDISTDFDFKCEYNDVDFNPLNDTPTSEYYINGSVSGVAPATKTLNITAYLEGLYAGSSTMSQASDDLGPHWPAGIADHITVELHNATNYSTIVYSVPDVALNTNGTATITIPATYSGSYYITIKHRNSIETTSATPISFAGSTITQSFVTPAQVFGGNLQSMGGGVYAIYGGDVNQDGAVDFGDMIEVDNDSYNYIYGYLYTDVNGDGAVDFGDMIIIDNNNGNYIGSAHP